MAVDAQPSNNAMHQVDFEKQIALRARHLMQVSDVSYLRSIRWGLVLQLQSDPAISIFP
jgi:hypothetical protein